MKKTNENLVILITLFAISIVIANVTGARTITTGLHIGPIELALSGGGKSELVDDWVAAIQAAEEMDDDAP